MNLSKLLFITSLLSFTFSTNLSAFENLWYYKEEERSRKSFLENSKKIDILGPQVYYLRNNGEIVGELKQDIIDRARRDDIKIMPLLANINFYNSKEYFDRPAVHNLLDDKKNWEKVANYMRQTALLNGYFGWQLDLENIDVNYRQTFNEFVKYLNNELKKDNLKLSIAVVSKFSDKESDYKIYETRHKNYWKYWAGVYDYKFLGENTDFVSVMMYDMPNSRGPVATISWQRLIINYALTQISEEKISFGIPSYGWAYRGNYLKDGTKHFTMVDYDFVYSKITNFDKSDVKNMTTGAGRSKIFGDIPWVSYNMFGKNYTIWYEDNISFKNKLEQIKKIAPKSHGISVWVLGDEDKKIWEQI